MLGGERVGNLGIDLDHEVLAVGSKGERLDLGKRDRLDRRDDPSQHLPSVILGRLCTASNEHHGDDHEKTERSHDA